MPAAALRFPADPALRRQLWKQWTHLDTPMGETRPIRRVMPTVERSMPADEWARKTIDATPGVVDGLRAAIAETVVDGQISLADRGRLIARGVRLGLNRFDANLLLAAVQHREIEKSGLRIVKMWKRPRQAKTRSVGTLVALCVMVEAVVAGAVTVYLNSQI